MRLAPCPCIPRCVQVCVARLDGSYLPDDKEDAAIFHQLNSAMKDAVRQSLTAHRPELHRWRRPDTGWRTRGTGAVKS